MTEDFHQSPRSRVAEAEKQLRIARNCLSEEHEEVLALLDETTREVKEIGDRIDALEQRDAADDERPAEHADVDAPSGESPRENTPSEGPHAK